MLICLIGPSAVGKTTIETELEKRGIAERLISTTDRDKRPKETEASYHFVAPEEFDKLELSESTTYAGARYGLSMEELNRTNDITKTFVFTCEINGAKQMDHFCKVPMVKVFLNANDEALIRRLRERGTPDIDKRIARIAEDKCSASQCDLIVHNEDWKLEETIKNIQCIIDNYIGEKKYA